MPKQSNKSMHSCSNSCKPNLPVQLKVPDSYSADLGLNFALALALLTKNFSRMPQCLEENIRVLRRKSHDNILPNISISLFPKSSFQQYLIWDANSAIN
jgi:hypothetical protein